MSLFRRSIAITLASAAVAALAGPLEAQSPIGKEISLSQLETHQTNAAFFPDGRFLFGFETIDEAGNDALRVKLFTQAGVPAAPEIVILQSPANRPAEIDESQPVPEADGSFWTVWYELSLTRSGIFTRHYSATGEPLADALQLNRGGSFFPDFFQVSDDRLIVLGTRFTPEMSWPQIAEFDAADGSLVRDFNVDQPVNVVTPLSLFLDSPDTFFAAWNTATRDPQTSAVWGRRFTRDGAPLGPPIVFNRRNQANWGNPEVARDGQGNFIAVWQAQEKDGPYEDIYAQRVSASGRTGGEAELTWALQLSPGDVPLMGDVDGDGRADPCVFRAGAFLCDTAHDGGLHPARLAFGQPGDRPLLGNLDGL